MDLGAPDDDTFLILVDDVHIVVGVRLLSRRLASVALDVGDGTAQVEVILAQVL